MRTKFMWIAALAASILVYAPAQARPPADSASKAMLTLENQTNQRLVFEFSENDAYFYGGKPKQISGDYVVGPKQTVIFQLPRKDDMSFRYTPERNKKWNQGGGFLDLANGESKILCYDSSDGIMCSQ